MLCLLFCSGLVSGCYCYCFVIDLLVGCLFVDFFFPAFLKVCCGQQVLVSVSHTVLCLVIVVVCFSMNWYCHCCFCGIGLWGCLLVGMLNCC